jgi:signal transduction histidine kinase
MPEGGEIEIVTKYLARAEMIEVRFIDSGVGIRDEAKDHIFEPLWTTKQSGSGLGLAIVREIIGEHGGQIECVADVQKGAEFRVVLPAAHPATTASQDTEVRIDVA